MEQSPQERFREYLAKQGMRLTREREIIVNEVFTFYGLFTVDQLLARFSQRIDGIRVSRSTVFRAVSDLDKAGLLRRTRGGDDLDFYQRSG